MVSGQRTGGEMRVRAAGDDGWFIDGRRRCLYSSSYTFVASICNVSKSRDYTFSVNIDTFDTHTKKNSSFRK